MEEMTNNNEIYSNWLDRYTMGLKELDYEQLRAEDHMDETYEGQEYADYLDYIDEWEWHANDQRDEMIRILTYHYCTFHKILKCDDHFHILEKPGSALTPSDKEKIYHEYIGVRFENITDVNRPMYAQCWYKTLVRVIDEVFSFLRKGSMALPPPLEIVLGKIAQWKLTNMNMTPSQLPYETFLQQWWNEKDKRSKAQHLLNANELTSMQNMMKPLVKVGKEKILYYYPEKEHSLHRMYKACRDKGSMLIRNISKLRMQIQNDCGITVKQVEDSINICEHCRKATYNQLAPFGVYYGPPGMGKTTAQEQGLLVALDTDWIGVGPVWTDYAPFLRERFPIITNQSEIFNGCGLRMIGVVKPSIRLDSNGIPFTTRRRVKEFEREHPKSITIIDMDDKKFLSDYVTHMTLINLMSNYVVNYCINQIPFYTNMQTEDWKRTFPRLQRKRRLKI